MGRVQQRKIGDLPSEKDPKKALVRGRVGGQVAGKAAWHNRALLKVAHYLRGRGEIGASPKEIVKITRLSRSTVYNLLTELVKSGKVIDQGGGTYRSKALVLDLTEQAGGRLGWHGIVIRALDWPIVDKDPLGPPPSPMDPAPLPLGNFSQWHRRAGQNEFYESYGEYLRRRVRFRWWPSTRTLLVYLNTSKNPLSLEEFMQLDGWFRAKCEPVDHGLYFDLVQLSMNIDYKHLVMEGLKCVRWAFCVNAAYTAYNKDGIGLRLEAEMRNQGAESIPWLRVFEGLQTLDPRVQEARANIALAQALAKHTETVEALLKQNAELATRVEALTKPRAPEKYVASEAAVKDSYQTGFG